MNSSEISKKLMQIASSIDESERPSKADVVESIDVIIASVERNKDKSKKSKPKKFDADTASSTHMGLLEKYRDFHDTGNNLLNFKDMIDGIPQNIGGNDVTNAQKECLKAFNELDSALRNVRSTYSSLMACLARY